MSGQDLEQLTLFPEDSPASLLVWLESKKVKGTTVISGLKCLELSESLRRVGSSVRTYLESCELPLPTLYRTWSVKAITSQCLILKLRLSARRTEESEYSLLPTVRSHETGNYQYSKGNHDKPVLTLTGVVKLFPTPTVRDYKDGSAESCKNVPVNDLLGRAVHTMFATPKAQNARANAQRHGKGSQSLDVQVGGQLNPDWVEWLMGFPIGWTSLTSQE